MGVMKSDALDSWRTYFRNANSNIFDVIEYAILVAASDCPKEFRLRRGRIAERLFSCQLTRCVGCDHVQVAVPEREEEEEDNEEGHGFKESLGCNEGFDNNKEESRGISSKNDGRVTDRAVSNYSYDEAEALTDEIEEESQTVAEVLRIKGVLENRREESDGVLFESLRRLQLMGLTVEHLKATEIGRAVNCVRKHGSKNIQQLARALVEGWKRMVDEWCNSGSAVTEGSPDSVIVNASVVDEEEGLPSPPLDEGAFLATQTTSMELSEFFEGMDDDGNPRNTGALDMSRGKQQPPHRTNLAREKNQIRQHEVINRQSMFSNHPSGSVRPPKENSEYKANVGAKPQQGRDLVEVQKKSPAIIRPDKSKSSNEISAVKLEASKRKLHERYQQLENAKKQRTIQVMELHDLPKQGLGNRSFHSKLAFNNRNRSNMRR
ncbi:hypothetical protein AAC387_Pa03g1110 [Persea americana]|eukprot:TRINITY_DN4875_c0_g1_i1.p1 TRINITY_DN4875_c0_g1~~TRINITY_DN4875_c0_g1_i1.p1  ORF type:complete len:435 (+),score=113.49 TRINITY_DN4875_c0_g1_i1:381-1685(+)